MTPYFQFPQSPEKPTIPQWRLLETLPSSVGPAAN
jgi:hypothetical protein